MKKLFVIFLGLHGFLISAPQLSAQCNSHKAPPTHRAVRVHYSSPQTPTVVDIAIGSPVHTTLVAAVKAADLVGTLQSAGPFTVFAPTNGAFNKLPEGTVSTLLKPDNKKQLTQILTYHVLAGKFDAATLTNTLKANNGKVNLPTVSGGTLTALLKGEQIQLKDENGGIATVTAADLTADNGIVHVIDSVVLPK